MLDKMAAAGAKAEGTTGKLTTASIAQGKALSGSVVPAAAKAAESLGGIEAAAKKIGSDSARHIGAGNAELVATAAKADSATAAIRQMGDAAQQSGVRVQASLENANAPAARDSSRSNVASLFPADGGQTAGGFAAVKKESTDAAKSIDDYIQKLQTTVATNGMSVRETKLYELALQGATKAQLEAADAAIRLDEGYQRGVAIGNTIRTTFIAAGIAAAAAAVSTLVATDAIIKQVAAYQDLSEKVGDTASNLASLQLASDVSGTSIDSIATASIRLTAALSKTDDESKSVGVGISALGLNFQQFKQLSPVEQLDAVAKSMGNFADGSEKTAVAVAIFGRAGAEMLPFLTELNNEGERQIKLTDDQIKAADAYADSQAALTSEFKTFLKLAATEATPILTAVQTVLADLAKDETVVSTATALMKAALGGAVILFQTVAVLGSDLGFVFLAVGREIGAMAAQLVALAHLDFAGFSAISDAVTADGVRARAELDKFQAKIMSIGQPAAPADTSNYSNEGRGKTKKLDISGLTPDKKRKGDGGAAREAGQLRKAALEQDLQGFRSALQAERDALALHDRLMQGEYRAGTLSLREFYDDKRATAAAAVAAQIAELDQERTRLEQDKRATKDPSEKVQAQTKINQIGDQQEKIRVRAAGEVQLANQEEAASFKALGDAVTNYRANLLQLQGDEVGAAKLRAQQAIESAGILAKQSGGQISADDIAKQKALTAAAIEFNDVQNRTGILAANGARAEESFAQAAQQSGLSLIDTERGIYAIRSEELAQLGALAEAARKLAEASTDPRIMAFAAGIAQDYARAADSIDPALNRLRAAQKELASGITSTLNASLSNFGQEYADRRRDANADIKSQKDEFSRKIDQLEGYLAQSQDKQDKARLRAKIKDLEAKKADAKGESKGGSLLKTISTTVLAPIGQQVFATVNKLLIADPLQNYLEAQLKGLTEGGGLFAGFFKDAMGIQADPKHDALLAQTAAISASTSAIELLDNAARNAAGSIPAIQGNGLPAAEDIKTTGDLARFDRSQSGEQSTAALFDEAAQAQQDASDSANLLGKNALTTATDLSRLAQAAGAGNTALSLLPNIIRLIQLSSTPAASGSSGGGLLGTIIGAGISYFSGGKGDMISNDESGALFSATGDMVRGRRASGGPVAPNSLYEVNEKGPEMLEMAGRQYLMMGKDGGNIIAHSAALAGNDGMQLKGARELGGPVSKNSAYRVNEKGPELLQVAGKQYLMMGSQPGSVQPTAVGQGKGGDTHITVQVTPPAGSNTATAQQWGATAGRQMQNAMRRNN